MRVAVAVERETTRTDGVCKIKERFWVCGWNTALTRNGRRCSLLWTEEFPDEAAKETVVTPVQTMQPNYCGGEGSEGASPATARCGDGLLDKP